MQNLPFFDDLLTVRPEVLDDGGIVTMVNLAAVGERAPRGLATQVPGEFTQADPAAFFGITFETEDACALLRSLSRRMTDPAGTPGTILLSGHFGLGKSHLMLLAHHALTSPAHAHAWAKERGVKGIAFPENVRVVTRSFIDQTAEDLWTFVLGAFGKSAEHISTFVDGQSIRDLLDDRPTVLILDELERWFGALPDAMKLRNLNFIQALTEVTASDGRLTLLTSVLGDHPEPAETIRRTKPLELSFRSTVDRERLIRFRLFDGLKGPAPTHAHAVIDAYIEGYESAQLEGLDEYRQRMLQTYPFTPEFLDILTKKVPNLGGFQTTRGTLRFLARVVRGSLKSRPLISSQDLPIDDQVIVDALSRLDQSSGGEVVKRALGDNRDAVPDSLAQKNQLLSALVFYSIADPTHPGATEGDLLRAALDPGENRNHLIDELRRLKEYAYNLHEEDGRYVFRARENPQARINAVARSPRVTDEGCREVILTSLLAAWGSPKETAVYSGDMERTSKALKALGAARPKYIISTRSLGAEPGTRLRLQNLETRRNIVLLVEPGIAKRQSDAAFDVFAEVELLRAARRIIACRILLEGAPESDARSVYDHTRRHEEQQIRSAFVDIYGVYVKWKRAGASGSGVDSSWFEEHPIDNFSSQTFLQSIRTDHANPSVAEYEVKKQWTSYRGKTVQAFIDHFECTPGAMVPYVDTLIPNAVRGLVAKRVFGLEDTSARRHADAANMADATLRDCTIIDPPPVTPKPVDEKPLVHTFVEGRYDATSKSVTLRWDLPQGGPFKTLVRRHTANQGWADGEVVNVGFDETREDNRYFDSGVTFSDPPPGKPALPPGVRYHYYVLLVEEGSDASAVVSRRIDIEIPPEETVLDDDLIQVPAQPSLDHLIEELEKTLMRGAMKSDTIARRVTIDIDAIPQMQALLVSTAQPTVYNAGGTPQVEGRVSYTFRGEWTRTVLTDLVARSPNIPGAQYRVSIRLNEE